MEEKKPISSRISSSPTKSSERVSQAPKQTLSPDPHFAVTREMYDRVYRWTKKSCVIKPAQNVSFSNEISSTESVEHAVSWVDHVGKVVVQHDEVAHAKIQREKQGRYNHLEKHRVSTAWIVLNSLTSVILTEMPELSDQPIKASRRILQTYLIVYPTIATWYLSLRGYDQMRGSWPSLRS